MAAIALCFSLLGSILGCGGLLLVQNYMQQEPEIETEEPDVSIMVQGYRENTVLQIVEIDTGKVLTPAQVYAANVNSTVGITTSITTNYWGYQTTSAASGSGFIVTDNGYIVTNYHVVEGSDSITVFHRESPTIAGGAESVFSWGIIRKRHRCNTNHPVRPYG